MKSFIYKLFSVLNYLLLSKVSANNSSFILCKSKIKKTNKIIAFNSFFYKTLWNIIGERNIITYNQTECNQCKFIINGSDNNIEIKSGVKLSELIVFIRGNHCRVTIDDKTTYNGGRIICQGIDNYIHIGYDCMISDHVEIWNSDTHQILDEEGNIINNSKPIKIGNHVWVGAYTKILKGVTIEDGAIVGMGSLVAKDIIERTLNVGTPSKTIKRNISWERKFIDV